MVTDGQAKRIQDVSHANIIVTIIIFFILLCFPRMHVPYTALEGSVQELVSNSEDTHHGHARVDLGHTTRHDVANLGYKRGGLVAFHC